MNNEEGEYDSEDDVSIRSLFSSMGSVDDYNFNDQSLNNISNPKNKKMYINEGSDFNSTSMFNFSIKQNNSKPIKFPNIAQNRKMVKLENHSLNIFNSTPQNKPIMVNANPSQLSQLGIIQNVVYTKPQNRFVIAVPNINRFPKQNHAIYAKRNNVRLVPISYESQNKNASSDKTVKVVHHHFIEVNANEKIMSKRNIQKVRNNKNESQIYNNISERNARNFADNDFFQSSPSLDYHEASQYFSYNENIGDIEKKTFFKKFS